MQNKNRLKAFIVFLEIYLIQLSIIKANTLDQVDYQNGQSVINKIYEPLPSSIINIEDLYASINLNQQSSDVQTYMSVKHPQLNIAYISSLQGGLFVIDLSSQQIVQQFHMNSKKIFLRSNTLFVSRGKEGYSIYQVLDGSGKLDLLIDGIIGGSVDSIYTTINKKYIYIGSEGYIYLIKVTWEGSKPILLDALLHVGIYSGETNYIYSTPDENYLMVANYSNGVSIINIINKEKPYLVTQKLPKWQVVDICIIQNGQIVYAIEEWYGMFVGDFQQLYVSESQFKANDKIWMGHVDFQTIARAITASTDENLLFVGLRSIGVHIFDISTPANKINPVLIQQVQIDGLANHIFLFNNDASFLYVNGCCVAIFNQVEANYNTEVPNIFNTHISRAFKQWSQNTWPWEYVYSSNSQYLYLASAYEGLQIFQLSQDVFSTPINLFQTNIFPSTSTDTIYLIEERSLLIQGCSEKGIVLWDISNLSKVVKVGEFNHPLANSDSDGIIYNKKLGCIAVANGYQGSYLLDIKDLSNLKIMSEINIIDFDLQVTAETVQMTEDGLYLILSLRYYGILIFNMKYLKSPNLLNNFHTYGGEKCLLSYDENYIFVSDSFKGLTIINFKDKEGAFIEKNLNLGSQVQYAFQSLINPNIIYLSLIENGQLAMVDVTDKQSPFIIAKAQFGDERSIALKEAPNKQFIAYLTSNGLRLQSIKLSIKIHTQIRQINKIPFTQNKFTYLNLNPKEILKVGQIIEFFFSSINIDRDMIIQQLFYYKNYEIKEIESWMQYFPSKKVFQMTIDKTALDNNNGCNIILLQILKKLDETSFIQKNLSLTEDLSKAIFNSLKKRAVLTDDNFLNLHNFFVDSSFYIDLDNPNLYKNMDNVQDYIKQIILQSIYYQPVKFIVKSSLTININYLQDNTKQPIITLSERVKVIIKIIEKTSTTTTTAVQTDQEKKNNSSYFVESQLGHTAQINLSQDFKSITIEGSTSDVNETIYNGLQVVFRKETDGITIQVTLTDSINYEFTENYLINQLPFLKNTSSKGSINSLQEQFDTQISESLTVQKDYTFIFSATTFQNLLPQKDSVNFNAYIKYSDKQYESISNMDWIEFDSIKRQFKWNGGLSQLQSKYTIVVNATISQYWVIDEFEIYFTRIPVEMIVLICLTSCIILLIILLLHCYKDRIQHIRYFTKYTYSSEAAFVNKQFSKIIILIPNYLGEFHKLWDNFLKNEKKENNNFKINLKKYLNSSKEIDVSLLIEKLKQIYESNKHFYSKLKKQEFKLSNIRLQYLTKGAYAFLMIKEDRATYEIYLQLKQIAKKKGYRKDWYKLYSKIIYPDKIVEKQLVNQTSEDSNSHSNIDSNHLSLLDQNFPIVLVDENKIYTTLEEANSTSCQKHEAFNHYLLFENIKAEAFGYIANNINRQESSYGETIHISSSNIKKIVAFRKNDDDESRFTCFPKYRQKYFFNFKEIQNLKNSNLPEWLKCDLSSSCINLSGKPTSSDVGDILIRIYDKNNYILNQFFLNVRKIRKQTMYQTGDLEGTQLNQYQYPPLLNFNSNMSKQARAPSKLLTSQGSQYLGGVGLNNQMFVMPSPNQIFNNITNSPQPSSTQITQIQSQNSGNQRILRNHRNNTQRFTIKQYQQFLTGDNNVIRFKSENQIKDSQLNENHKKNSDEIIYQRSPISPQLQQEDSLTQDRNNELLQMNNQGSYNQYNNTNSNNNNHSNPNYNSNHLINNNSSNYLQTQQNQPDIRVYKEDETIFSKCSNQQQSGWSRDLNSDHHLTCIPLKKNQEVVEEDIIQEEQYASQKEHKSASSFMYNRPNNKYKLSLQLNDTHSNSAYKNMSDNYDLEKSLSTLSYDIASINSPKLTQFKPRSIRSLNVQKLNSMDNLN